MPDINRQFVLAARPVGEIKDSDFRYQETPLPALEDGQVLLRTLYLSLDPAMRGWMNAGKDSYVAPVEIGEVMRGGTIGEVVESRNPEFETGDKVWSIGGWQSYSVAGPKGLMMKVPAGLELPLTNFLSVLGMTGLTAYFGLLDIGKPVEGDTVVVSAAAGAVGSIVGQIAKIKGCRVIGIAGSEEKCRWIQEELGFDGAINYKTEHVAKKLRALCPDRINVYFDNVGGPILNDVLGYLAVHARIAICGAISQYNATELPPGPGNYITLLTKRSRMEGFIVTDFAPRFQEAITELAQWVLQGRLKHREDIVEGLENAPKAIHKLFDGSNDGKLIIKVS